jgi:alkyl sulfatase BDS1-like metallo-beta-lactamase superfamily hydrolase
MEYMGGVGASARVDIENGDGEYRWAEPDNAEARELAATAHAQLGCQAKNATWRNAY